MQGPCAPADPQGHIFLPVFFGGLQWGWAQESSVCASVRRHARPAPFVSVSECGVWSLRGGGVVPSLAPSEGAPWEPEHPLLRGGLGTWWPAGRVWSWHWGTGQGKQTPGVGFLVSFPPLDTQTPRHLDTLDPCSPPPVGPQPHLGPAFRHPGIFLEVTPGHILTP